MEKDELISQVVEKSGVSENEVVKILEAFTASIKEGLRRGESVTIAGFGTFSLKNRKASKFLNPKNNQPYEIPERKLPHFKAGQNLKALLESN